MMNKQLVRALRGERQLSLLQAASCRVKPRPFESTRISDQTRYEDHPAPTEDDMISKDNDPFQLFSLSEVHYLKHHPLYEFRDLDEFHVDNYRHWLHGRSDYWNTESYPAQISPWEMGSKWNHTFFLLVPLISFYWFGNQYVSCDTKTP